MNKSILALMVAVLSGCAVGPNYHQPATETPSAFDTPKPVPNDTAAQTDQREATIFAAPFVADMPIVQFWTVFDDTVLNSLVAQALVTNHDIRIAAANLKAARAIRGGAISDLFPAVGIEASRDKSRASADETVSGEPESSRLNRGNLDAYWELDLFGRVRRNIEASGASAQAINEDLHAAKVSVAAEVARNYMELRGAQEQFAVAQHNADNQKQTLGIVVAREDAGRGTEFDTARAQALLNTTLSQLPVLQADIDVRIHRLSVLLGQQPAVLSDMLRPVVELPGLPRLVQIGKPEDLLRRRPDVRAAERRLAAATANIGVAQADWFPRVSFRGEIGFAANTGERIGDADTATYRYGPGISWSALDFGHVRARVLQSKAQAEGSLASYEQTVLRALEETDNALTLYSSTRQQLDHLQASVTFNQRAAELAHLRFENGGADFLEVLDVERERLETDASYTRARTAAATNLIAVYKALGGGWETGNDNLAQQ
jgi:multidrug efflux system outer membrane protein